MKIVKRYKRKNFVFYIFLFALLIISLFISIEVGTTEVGVLKVILEGKVDETSYQILFIRVSQSLAILIAGLSLSISGLILQRIMKNNLVDPGITGVLTGSALGITLVSILNFNMPIIFSTLKIIVSFIFGITIGGILLAVSLLSKDSLKVIIFGVIINSFLSGVIVLVQSLIDPFKLYQTFSFLMGGVGLPEMNIILLEYIIASISIIILFFVSKMLDIISLGDVDAHVLGIDVRLWRSIFLVISVLLASVSVSLVGVVGFLGFIIPNIVSLLSYKFISIDTNNQIILSGIIGGTFLLICHTISKILLPMYELPIGVITGLVGAPIFAILMLRIGYR